MSIDDALLAEAKRLALERHCSLGEVFTEALRQLMMARRPAKAQNPTRLTTFKGKGIQPGVDLDSNASIDDAIEEQL